MKKLTFLFALLCASMMGFAAIDWSGYEYLGDGAGGGAYSNKYKLAPAAGQGVVNIQRPGWATADGIYTTFPAGVSECSLGVGNYDIDGAGVILHLSAFTAKETEVTVKHGTGTCVFTVYYADGTEGGSTPDPVDPEPDPEPTPNSYTAGGHTITLDASYVDDIYTLVISSSDAMESLGGSFWNVNGVGADMRTNAGTSSYTVSGDKKTITCQVQSSTAPNIYTPLYVMMPGEVNFGNVTLNWEDRTPITSEYCNYQGPETQQDNHYYAITWETDPSGNVVITIGNGTGAGACSFRNGGFEGGNNGLNNFVVSADNFATTTPAADYFTVTRPSDGDLQYVLTKIADLPAGAKIKHLSAGAIAWKEGSTNRWCFPEFIYTYGGTCNQLDAPTNVAINANNILTFDAVAGADSYMAYVYLGGVEKYSQAVASGDELTFVPLISGDYTVNVIASGAGKVDSDPSADYVWQLEAAPIVLGNSEYCEKNMSSGNTEAAFTWETDENGNIIITISEVLGGAADAAHFRGNGMALDKFKIGAGKTPASTYFNHACGGSNQVTLSLKNPANAPAPGEKIYFTNSTVEYTTSKDGNAWPSLTFEYTYGTVCSGKSVSATVNNNTMGSAVAKVGDDEVTSVDENTEVTFIATSADPALYRFVNWTKGGVEVSTSATYAMTITETTNLVANFDYIRETYCHYELLATGGAAVGKKLYMTLGSIGGGKYQIKYEGSAEAPLLALNNANYMVNNVSTDIEYIDPVSGNPVTSSGGDVPFNKQNGRWSFDATGNGSAKMEFELAPGKTIDDIYVWGNAIFFNTPLGELVYEDNNDRLGLFGMNAAKRHNIDWEATCSDAEAPVFDKAEAEVLSESSVRLKIQATDNWGGLLTYTISRAGADDIVSNHASGEEFTEDVDGLTAGTEYTFTVTVNDGVNNANRNILVTPIADNVKPEMGEASLASKTWNSAIINVAATDNKGVTAYYVVEKDADYVATEGKITIEGLTAATAYTYHIKAKDAAGNISDNQAEVSFTTDAHFTAPQEACAAPTWDAALVKAIYSPTYSADCGFGDWGGGPVYAQEEYGKKYILGDWGFFGMTDFSLNCINMEKLHYDIWIENDATIRIVPICRNSADTGNETEYGATVNLAGQTWNSVDLTLATDYASVTNWSKVYQVKIDQASNLTFWVANAYFYRETAYVDTEAPTNASASKVAEGFYSVQISAQAEDNSGAVSFKVMNGDEVLATGAAASGAVTSIMVNNLTPGTNYNFNVVAYDEANNEAEPVVVVAETKFMPAAAPAPDFGNKKVVAVFTDAMACAVSDIHSGGWGETTQVEWLDIAEGDKVFYAQNFNYAGWHSWAGGNIDATGMQYLHVDIYSTGMTAVNVTPISAGREGVATINLTPNAWTSYDVPLSAYEANNIDWANIFQFKFMGPVGGNELMIDNVYFWSYQITPNAAQGTDAGGWATFASPVDLAVPAGMTAYKASYQKTETEEILNLTPISVIPANAGVILKGTAGEAYTFAPATEPAPDMSDNVLVGCVTRTDVSAVRANNDIFCMRYSGLYDFTGFFLYEGQYVPAGRAYLPLPKESNAPAAAQRRVRFVFNQEQVATGMENADTTVEAVKFIENGQLFIRRGEAVYSIQGVRVK